MKTTLKKMIVFMLMMLVAGTAAASTLTVRADNWPPYNADPADKKPGYMIEVLKEIFEPQGIVVDYQLMPWTRTLNDVNAGKYDAAVGTDRDESPDMIFGQEHFGMMLNNLYAKAGSGWRCAGVESLAKVRVGVIDGYGYGPLMDEYIEKNRQGGKLFVASGDDALPQLIKMLKAGRIDAVIENVNVMAYTLGALGITGIVSVGAVDKDPTPLEVGFSPKRNSSKNYAQIFDAGIAKLRASGRLAEILAGYGVQDWK